MEPRAGATGGALRAILSDRAVSTVIGLALLLNLGTGMVLPVLPLYARSYGVDYSQAGLLVAAFYFARLAFDLAAGAVLDRLGVPSAAALGLLILAGGAVLTGLSPVFILAVLCWAAAGAGAAIVWAAMYNGLIRSVPKPRMARALGIFYGAFNGGIVAGGFLGGLIAARLGFGAPLFFLAAIAVALAVLMKTRLDGVSAPQLGRRLPFAPGSDEGSLGLRSGTLPKAATLLRRPGFLASVVSLLANLWLFGAVFSTLVPLFARDELHLSPAGIGVLYAVALAAEFLAYWPAGSWADRRGRRFVLLPALAGSALAAVLVGWAPSAVVFAVLLALVGLASGFAGVPPAAILADVLPENDSATGVAIFRFGGDLGFSLGPLIAGLSAASFGFKAAFAIAGIPALIALLVVGAGRETLVAER